jgi:hypothetical protein
VSIFRRGDDGTDPLGRLGGPDEIRNVSRSSTLAVGTLACPTCDAPVSPSGRLTPASALTCPFCGESGHVRDFLTLGAPTRAAHVVIKIISPAEIRITRRRPEA